MVASIDDIELTGTELFDGHRVELQIYEGPVDLLLHLVRREAVEIADVAVAEITDDYLKYLQTLAQVNTQLAGDFIVMAARLLLLKSRALLPREPQDADEAEEEEHIDPERQLQQRLAEYRQYKQAASLLSESRQMRKRVFLRSTSESEEIGTGYVPLQDVSVFDMVSALQEMLKRSQQPQPQLATPREITTGDCIDDILLRLEASSDSQCRFTELIDLPASKLRIIMVFLATLELIRRRRIRIRHGADARELIVYLGDSEEVG